MAIVRLARVTTGTIATVFDPHRGMGEQIPGTRYVLPIRPVSETVRAGPAVARHPRRRAKLDQ